MTRRSEALAASAGEVFAVAGTTWHIAYTHWRSEIRARESLEAKGYAVLTPTQHVEIRHAGKRLMVERPMFPRYLFVDVSPAGGSWYPILSAIGITGLITNNSRPVTVPLWIMRNLLKAQAEDAFSTPVEMLPAFKGGDAVRFKGGSFENFVGTIQRAPSGRRASVLVDMMGRKQEFSVPVADLVAA